MRIFYDGCKTSEGERGDINPVLLSVAVLVLCLMKEHLLARSNPHDLSLSLILANAKGGAHRIVHIQLATQSFTLIQRCKHIKYTDTHTHTRRVGNTRKRRDKSVVEGIGTKLSARCLFQCCNMPWQTKS